MKKTSVPHIEIILPVFNEVKNILPLVKQLDAARDSLGEQATVSYLFVNDGSKDGTRQLLHRLFRERPDLRIVDLIHNFGHGSAIAAGLEHFQGDIAVLMDADLQDDPQSLLRLFEAWRDGAKTVVAERGEREEKGSFLFKAFYFVLHKTAKSLPPMNFGTHCLLDKSVVERLAQIKERNRYFPGLVSYASGEITGIPFDRHSRVHGKSRVGLAGLFNLAITALVSFSNAPVRLVSVIGIACSLVAVTAGLTIVAIKIFTEKAIPGWASTMTVMTFGSGIQLFCLGIIGEYAARIYEEVKQRPMYLVDRVLERKSGTKKTTSASRAA